MPPKKRKKSSGPLQPLIMSMAAKLERAETTRKQWDAAGRAAHLELNPPVRIFVGVDSEMVCRYPTGVKKRSFIFRDILQYALCKKPARNLCIDPVFDKLHNIMPVWLCDEHLAMKNGYRLVRINAAAQEEK